MTQSTHRNSTAIFTLQDHETLKFAAEELRRYLQLMDDVQIVVRDTDQYSPATEPGIYLGLFDDVGINAPPLDQPDFDDAIEIDVTRLVGTIVGSNTRSVLLAVYRFLEQAGCRWVRPGRDGEYIPRRDLELVSVQLHEQPSHRYRGICIEGAVSLEHMLDSIDWAPKVGFNAYMLEFMVPYTFFDRWYHHLNNPYKAAEELTVEMVVSFKVQMEREIKKRGLMYHSVGHGWTCEPLGIPGLGWDPKEYSVSAELRPYLAEVEGERSIYRGIPLNTNLCYSNPEARQRVVDYAVRYMQENDVIDVLHVWLADGSNNHCECEQCRHTLPADYYVQLLNEMDAAFTERGIDTRIAFIAYLDLLWVPRQERFSNPDRFVLLFAPISRTYSRSYDIDTSGVTLPAYERNQLSFPADITENLAHLEKWRQEVFDGDAFTYEYYFMWDHYFDPAYYETAKILCADVKKLKRVGLNGIMSDQTQRSFFPTGFGMYVLGKSLWDESVEFDRLAREYFGAAFGEDGDTCRDYMARLSQLFDSPYLRGDVQDDKMMEGEKASHTWILDASRGAVSLQAARRLGEIPSLIEEFLPIIEKNRRSENACWAKSWEYVAYHAKIAKLLAEAFQARAEGKQKEARQRWQQTADLVQRNEDALQPVLDVFEFIHTLENKYSDPEAT